MDSLLLLAGVGALFVALLVGLVAVIPDRERAEVRRTLRTVDQGYRLPGAVEAGPASGAGELTRQATDLGRRLTPGGGRGGLGRRLDQAGNPAWLKMDLLFAYKGLFLLVGAAAGLVVGLLVAGPAGTVVWVLVGAAAGFFGPDLLVLHLAQERQQAIRRTLPDILDTLVVTVEAGLGFEAALAQVVRNGRGPMVGEFARVLHEMQIGRPRVEALREMAARTSVTELRAFASAVVQATTLGVPVANVLRQQAAEMRLRRRQRAEELAQKIPVKILFPMILCIFPALFVVVVGPGAIRLLETFAR
ncbi:type II secretion system F family protein [Micromonospora endolithica]|uniref:Type II secretion system F family protein n=1 Tax=Micromonospora endolithica TaxID=230091 RepID=A0A3A9ZD41_9ACTN|nr:type II secretion system F family protein [Micromonospora endolithica]RKN46230.1 type II secretion system F family protein [Micromonospora endolithica]TWJ25049.1 tight adherence protein C [Micromonospora endolithica]